MAKGKLSYDEICELSENSNVVSVSENRITYTEEFKLHFVEEYMLGKGATRIFREAGFDTKVLGAKRIERAAARWKAAYKSGTLGIGKTERISREDVLYQIEKNQRLIQKLQEENELLKIYC